MDIIKGKPIPVRRMGVKSKWGECDQMEVGDCVVVGTRADANTLVCYLRHRHKKAATRHLPEGGIGVWRTE